MVDQSRVRAVFNEAAELTGAERSAYLDDACRNEPEVRARVEALLAAAEREDDFLSSPTSPGGQDDAGATLETPAPMGETPTLGDHHESSDQAAMYEGPGSQIGPYKLLQSIGEGGFGSVFMAEQREPVQRKVALKIIKLGMDTRQVVARFEQERQALAIMDHPNIARVFDAGVTQTGRPYFVMELCTGEPITTYCDRARLNVRERLELFAQVCNAVQHAHQKGVIHRDIKPSNVLVSTHDGKPHAKVIDFGIAKATANRLTEKTFFTEHRQIIGTPEYMSPEQAEGSLDIDTRTDVYSLGALLYELLTGLTPFDSRSLRSAAYAEIQRIIREVDPPRPSTRLSQSAEAIAGFAASRHTEPKKLGAIVRGELDWIVMKALEKDRSRRYETASGLALDIQRYLGGEAVVAAPASRSYRVRKFVRRNKGPVTAGAAVAAALLIGVVAFAWQASVARQQRDLAIAAQLAEVEQRREADAQRDRAARAEEETRRRADQLEEVASFQSTMLSSIDVASAGADLMRDIRRRFSEALEKQGASDSERAARVETFTRELRVVNATDTATELIDRTILAPAIEAVDTQFTDQPVVDASLRHTLAEIYMNLGRYEDGRTLQNNALETRRRELGEDHNDTLVSQNNLGLMLARQGRVDEAEAIYRETIERRRRAFGEEHPEALTTMVGLGNLLRTQARYEEAEALFLAALDASRRTLGDEDLATLVAINNLGYLRIDQGRLSEAEPLWREAYETGRRVLGAEHPDVIVWTNNMGGIVQAQGRHADSERYFREAYEANRRLRGERHPQTLAALRNVAISLSRQGRPADAEAIHRVVFEARRIAFGDDHPETISCLLPIGIALRDQGKLAEAELYMRDSLERNQETFGHDHPESIIAMQSLAGLRSTRGDVEEAEALLSEALERSTSIWGEDHPDRLILINNLGSLLVRAGRLEDAEPYVVNSVEASRRVRGANHPETAISLSNLSRLYEMQEKHQEAEATIREAQEIFHATLGPGHPNTLICGTMLGGNLRKLDRRSEAEIVLRESALGLEAALGQEHVRTAGARFHLGRVLLELERHADAETELIEAMRVFSLVQGASARSGARTCAQSLVTLYEEWGQIDLDPLHQENAERWRVRLAELDAEETS
ncbi:MAG: serine/threonine protein kinase [Phycisphaeraceae bacterium]|nr:MAG: serine/threonine protein kinase [Phycisphaeraceae bacterium]